MKETKNGHLVFVLHNHLPYVISHGTWPHGMDWLNEAAAETYVPLLDMLHRLKDDGIISGLTVGITPVLAEQLADQRFKDGFVDYCQQKIAAASEDIRGFEAIGESQLLVVARFWHKFYSEILNRFDQVYTRDIIAQFRNFQDEGHIEIITCAATHGYLALLGRDECVRAQIQTGVSTYRKHFGRDPRGIWLPECAYRPRYEWKRPVGKETDPVMRHGVEELLDEAGIKYFFVDTHLLRGGKPIGTYLERFDALKQLWQQFEMSDIEYDVEVKKSPYKPYLAASKGSESAVSFFTRDPETTVQVWSGEHGYPGNGEYLDFHKKHFPGGHRYWRVTSAKVDLGDKLPYEPEKTESILHQQSTHFAELVNELLESQKAEGIVDPVVCSPYDGELFGHWWFEGPRWLENIVRTVQQSDTASLATAGEYLENKPCQEVISLPEGSWGEGGFHHVWLNENNDWSWNHVYEAEDSMVDIARRLGNEQGIAREIIEQMARELLLLESSDWQFLISTWSARDYAEARIVKHSESFRKLKKMAEKALVGEKLEETDMNFLRQCQSDDALFDIDLTLWAAEAKVRT